MTGNLKEQPFDLPVAYNGKEIILPAKLVEMGYTYKIFVTVQEQDIIFEPDEERNLRAIIQTEKANASISADLVKAIGESLAKNLGG
jgi:hypothetical protein